MINEAWPMQPLGEVALQMQYGLSQRGEKAGQYPILRMNCLREGSVSFNNLQFVDLRDETAQQFLLKGGDVLFNRTNSYELVGRTALVEADVDAVFASYLVRISVDQRLLDPRFLNFFLNWKVAQEGLKALATRAVGQANISAGKLRYFQIPIPDIHEQSDIATALTQVRAAMKLHEQSLAVSQDLKRAAMATLFTRGLKGEAQKETDIGLVPESWNVVVFGSMRNRLQYGTSMRCTYDTDGFPVLRIPNIEPGYVNALDLKFANMPAAEAVRYRLETGDLIFIRTNGVIERLGSCTVYADEPKNALFASYLIRAQIKLDKLDPYFASYFFGSELGTSIIAGRATPAADGKYNLNTGTIDGLPIPLPPTLNEQREIVAILDGINRKIDLHRKKRDLLDELFKSLLHKLMTGEIRVADLDLSAIQPPIGVAAQ